MIKRCCLKHLQITCLLPRCVQDCILLDLDHSDIVTSSLLQMRIYSSREDSSMVLFFFTPHPCIISQSYCLANLLPSPWHWKTNLGSTYFKLRYIPCKHLQWKEHELNVTSWRFVAASPSGSMIIHYFLFPLLSKHDLDHKWTRHETTCLRFFC